MRQWLHHGLRPVDMYLIVVAIRGSVFRKFKDRVMLLIYRMKFPNMMMNLLGGGWVGGWVGSFLLNIYVFLNIFKIC